MDGYFRRGGVEGTKHARAAREMLMRLESAYLFVEHGPKLPHAQSKHLIFNFAMKINKSKEQNRVPGHV